MEEVTGRLTLGNFECIMLRSEDDWRAVEQFAKNVLETKVLEERLRERKGAPGRLAK